VGPRAGLDGCCKSRPPPGFDPRTAQLVASRYADYTYRKAYVGRFCVNPGLRNSRREGEGGTCIQSGAEVT
jgi:hypothetical protein